MTVSTEKGFELMAEILPYMAEILNDPDGDAAVKPLREKGKDADSGDVMSSLMPIFLTKHREATFHIAAAFCGKSYEEVLAQPLHDTVEALRGGVTADFIDFFVYCMHVSRAM